MHSSSRSFERFAALLIIVAAHLLFLEIFVRNGKAHVKASGEDAQRSELFFIEIPPTEDELPQKLEMPQRAASLQHKPAAPNAITLPKEQLVPEADIDWYGGAADVAREGLAKSQEPKPRAFGEQPQSPYSKRAKRKPGYQWQPEEKKAGFVGPLPYVRLGKRCVLIPPFFGCALGKLSKSKGETLDEMRDPQRPRSSVPDVEE